MRNAVHVREILDEHAYRTLPLFSRAWCFQERNLSSRVVHFAADELYWECMTTLTCECSNISHQVSGFWPMKRKLLVLKQPLAPWDEVQMTPQRQWRQIVEEYSAKKLSYPTDISLSPARSCSADARETQRL